MRALHTMTNEYFNFLGPRSEVGPGSGHMMHNIIAAYFCTRHTKQTHKIECPDVHIFRVSAKEGMAE